MAGLILKDLLNLRKDALYMFIALPIFLVLSHATGQSGAVPVLLGVSSATMILQSSSYDEKNDWDSYAACFPAGRISMINAKYLLGLIIALLAGSMNFLQYAASIASLSEVVTGSIWVISGIVALNSVSIPLTQSKGSEKTRIMLVAVIFLPVMILYMLTKDSYIVIEPLMVMIASFAAYFVSYPISRKIILIKSF